MSKVILVGFISRVVGASLSPLFCEELMAKYKINTIHHYRTTMMKNRLYGNNFSEILKKHIHSLDYHLEEIEDTFQHHELITKIHSDLKDYDDATIIFNIGGGQSKHQAALTEVLFKLRDENKKLKIYLIYADLHSTIKLIKYNFNGSSIESDLIREYQYAVNISFEDFLKLENKEAFLDKNNSSISNNSFFDNKTILTKNWKAKTINEIELWKSLIQSLDKNSNLRTNHNYMISGLISDYILSLDDKSLKKLNKYSHDTYNNSTYNHSKLIKAISNTKKAIETNQVVSFKELWKNLFHTLDYRYTTNHNTTIRKKGFKFEEIFFNYLVSKINNSTSINCNSIFHNINIKNISDRIGGKLTDKEYDLVILTNKMTFLYFDIKTRPITANEDYSTYYQILSKSSSEYNQLKYIIPLDSTNPNLLSSSYFNIFIQLEQRNLEFYFFDKSRTEEKLYLSKKGGTKEIKTSIPSTQAKNHIVLNNIDHYLDKIFDQGY